MHIAEYIAEELYSGILRKTWGYTNAESTTKVENKEKETESKEKRKLFGLPSTSPDYKVSQGDGVESLAPGSIGSPLGIYRRKQHPVASLYQLINL